MLRFVTLGVALSILVAACALLEPVVPKTEPSPAFLQYLADNNQEFTTAPVPASGVVSPDVVVEKLR